MTNIGVTFDMGDTFGALADLLMRIQDIKQRKTALKAAIIQEAKYNNGLLALYGMKTLKDASKKRQLLTLLSTKTWEYMSALNITTAELFPEKQKKAVPDSVLEISLIPLDEKASSLQRYEFTMKSALLLKVIAACELDSVSSVGVKKRTDNLRRATLSLISLAEQGVG